MSFCEIFLSLLILLMALIFDICNHITCDHVSPLVSSLFVASQSLVLERQVGGV
jgi:hypothetical protein